MVCCCLVWYDVILWRRSVVPTFFAFNVAHFFLPPSFLLPTSLFFTPFLALVLSLSLSLPSLLRPLCYPFPNHSLTSLSQPSFPPFLSHPLSPSLTPSPTPPPTPSLPPLRPIEESLIEFERMRTGRYGGSEATLRMKMDMTSPNPNMWDQVRHGIKRPRSL